MRTLAMFGVAAIVLGAAGIAVAQPAPAPGAPEAGPMGEGGPPGHPGMHDGPSGMQHHMMRHGMMRMMAPSKAARFHFARGDSVVHVKCADDEPMRTCVDAAGALFDKVTAQPAK